ncbi:MAG: DUF4956 domain-containing protein [Pseudomonadota bacterium]
MNQTNTFEQFLASQTPHVPLAEFVLHLAMTFVLASLLALLYARYGGSLSNRKAFSKNLVLIAMTTMLIITIVKSSLALSLGLVGALSIVRFRTPIKEPEELAYLFLAIAMGLGLGAGQRAVTLTGFVLIAAAILVLRRRKPGGEEQGMLLSVSSPSGGRNLADRVMEVLEAEAGFLRLRRMDHEGQGFTGDFLVRFDGYDHFVRARDRLAGLDETLSLSFLDNRMI